MSAFPLMFPAGHAPLAAPFQVEIVGLSPGPLQLASRVPVTVQRGIAEIAVTDIVILPSILLPPEGWVTGPHTELVAWLRAMHARGALICAACSGRFLIAETGFFDGAAATVHTGDARPYEPSFPTVPHSVIVPAILLPPEGWVPCRHPELVAWLRAMHARGALICSACSGIFLIAETGLFDGVDATVHWGYARQFAQSFPAVPIHPERVLVVAGKREELISSGASMTWHDLVLYLIARHAGATAAQAVARLFALQWHQDGLAPYKIGRAHV